MRRRGIDVVVALVDTHGRDETAGRIADLEVVPRRTVAYKGATLEEMDLDAVLARKPEVAVVDELAHTNAPGSKNEKRWQDVLDLLAAGISVMTAVNVQHLEGVQDVVKSATGLEVKERVPDRVIREADAVVNVDLPGPELRDRLKQGKIYPPAQAAQALENFFREENLRALRELALRETAENVDHGPSETAPSAATSGSFAPGPGRARRRRACRSTPSSARALIRRGSRMAGRMNTRWYALYVRRKRDRPERLSAKRAPRAHREHPARDLPRRHDRLPRVRGRLEGSPRLRPRGEGRSSRRGPPEPHGAPGPARAGDRLARARGRARDRRLRRGRGPGGAGLTPVAVRPRRGPAERSTGRPGTGGGAGSPSRSRCGEGGGTTAPSGRRACR